MVFAGGKQSFPTRQLGIEYVMEHSVQGYCLERLKLFQIPIMGKRCLGSRRRQAERRIWWLRWRRYSKHSQGSGVERCCIYLERVQSSRRIIFLASEA